MPLTDTKHTRYYRIIQARDEHYDDIFFFAVKSTGIYCRPSCPARRPLPQNCLFVSSAREAEQAGFRPCKRCKPDKAKNNKIYSLLTQLQRDAQDDDDTREDLLRARLTNPQLRRLVKRETGFTPLQLHQKQRLRFAKSLLLTTDMKVIEVAFRAQFSSLRQFNYAFKRAYGASPRALRKTDHIGLKDMS